MCNYSIMLRIRRVFPSVTAVLNKYHFENLCHKRLFNAQCIRVIDEVSQAVNQEKPVVALESTIITHGMPYPHNLRTAIEVQDIMQQYGVVPATIGVLNGKIHVGMNNDMLKELAKNQNTQKLSRRDLAVACAKNYSGGTTVSATMLIAHRCGIKVFVTGGIGGVHRMGQETMDVSADLRELGQTPLMVISAGVKSILDVQRTLEYLETEGVTVATFGKSNDFPGFFTRSSGHQSPAHVDTIEEAASLLTSHSHLKLNSGILLAVPIPDQYAELGRTVEKAIETALKETENKNIAGNKVTPYVLKRVNEITDGLSLEANITLVKNNAKIGAQVAKQYYNCDRKRGEKLSGSTNKTVVVVGGSNVDVISKCSGKILGGGPSNTAKVAVSSGGVGRNMTEALLKLNANPYFISAIGNDLHGEKIIKDLQGLGLGGISKINNQPTSVYNTIVDRDGETFVAVNDSDIHDKIDVDMVRQHEDKIKCSSLVCMDSNISNSAMQYICSVCSNYKVPLLFEPTGVLIAGESYLSCMPYHTAITYMTPNIDELIAIYQASTGEKITLCEDEVYSGDKKSFQALADLCKPLLKSTYCVIVTLGKYGILSSTTKDSSYKFVHYSLDPPPAWSWLELPVANTSGGGDSFTAGFVQGLLRYNGNLSAAIRVGITASQRTIRSDLTVSSNLHEMDGILQGSEWQGRELDFLN